MPFDVRHTNKAPNNGLSVGWNVEQPLSSSLPPTRSLHAIVLHARGNSSFCRSTPIRPLGIGGGPGRSFVTTVRDESSHTVAYIGPVARSSPGGATENSPAIYRWGWNSVKPLLVPQGRLNCFSSPCLSRPSGTFSFNYPTSPAINRWAILNCPSGTEILEQLANRLTRRPRPPIHRHHR